MLGSGTTRDSCWQGGLVDVTVVSAVLALGACYIELLLAAQDVYWLGGTGRAWLESLGGLGGYTAFLVVVGTILWLAVRLVLRRGSIARLLPLFSSISAALLLWGFLRQAPATRVLGLDRVVCGGLFAFAVVPLVLRITSTGGYCAVMAAGLLSGVAALREGTLLFLGRSDCVTFSLVLSAASAALTMVAGMLFLRPNFHRGVAATLLAVACGILPLGLHVTPWVMGLGQVQHGPSVVLITADSLRADCCSVYDGRVPTPSLEVLTERGVLFTRAYSLAPWTVPSLDGLVAGKYPPGPTPGAKHEVHKRDQELYFRLATYWLGDDGETLVGRLRDRGYSTAAFIGNPIMLPEKWLWGEFAHCVHVLHDRADPYGKRHLQQLPLLRERLAAFLPFCREMRLLDSTRLVMLLTSQFLRLHRNESVCVWAHFLDPHSPYAPPRLYRPKDGPWLQFPPEGFNGKVDESWVAELPPDQREYAQCLYEGEVQYVDHAVGRIVETLEALGMPERTYVVFSSDHGEEFWSHGGWQHGHSLYEELIHVPLIIAGPGIEPGVAEQPVSAIDLMPTLADLLDMESCSGWAGASLAPMLCEDTPLGSGRLVFGQATMANEGRGPPEPLQTVVSGRYKLIRGVETGDVQLFDLDTDPGEHHDVAQENEETVEELSTALDTWGLSFPVSFAEFERAPGFENLVQEPSEKTKQLLRALGYL